MINNYNKFLNKNLIKESTDEEINSFKLSVDNIEKRLKKSEKNITSKYNLNTTQDNQIINIDGSIIYYAIFTFKPIPVEEKDIKITEQFQLVNGVIFKLPIKIIGVNNVNGTIQYTYKIINYNPIKEYKELINKYVNNITVYNSKFEIGKIKSKDIFSNINNISEVYKLKYGVNSKVPAIKE